jgi:ubiquitin carboxyl-terminal hydrolase L5
MPEKSAEPQQFPTPRNSEPSEDEDLVADTQRLPAAEETSPATVRRSDRARKPPPVKLSAGTPDDDGTLLTPTLAKSVKSTSDETRRNLKRKAAPEAFEVPDNLLDEALAPMQPGELEDWDSWVEIESDPDLFNLILQNLGVEGVKVQELFGGVEEGLGFVPYVFTYSPFSPAAVLG